MANIRGSLKVVKATRVLRRIIDVWEQQSTPKKERNQYHLRFREGWSLPKSCQPDWYNKHRYTDVYKIDYEKSNLGKDVVVLQKLHGEDSQEIIIEKFSSWENDLELELYTRHLSYTELGMTNEQYWGFRDD